MAIFDRLFGRKKNEEQQSPVQAPTSGANRELKPESASSQSVPTSEFQDSERSVSESPVSENSLPEPPAAKSPASDSPAGKSSHLLNVAESVELLRRVDQRQDQSQEARELARSRGVDEVLRHMIATPLPVLLGPGGDGSPTLKAKVVNSKRLLTIFLSREEAEQACAGQEQLAHIPGEVLMGWALSQPKVHGIRFGAQTQQPELERKDLERGLEGFSTPAIREMLLVQRPTPQKVLEALRHEGSRVLVVQRKAEQGSQMMTLDSSDGPGAVLPVFTSSTEVAAWGTSLTERSLDVEQLRLLVKELGVHQLRVNPAGPGIDLPANSL